MTGWSASSHHCAAVEQEARGMDQYTHLSSGTDLLILPFMDLTQKESGCNNDTWPPLAI